MLATEIVLGETPRRTKVSARNRAQRVEREARGRLLALSADSSLFTGFFALRHNAQHIRLVAKAPFLELNSSSRSTSSESSLVMR
jgi:hypothetical protein